MALDIGTVLMQWQSAGVFDYLLPFLLVFALVYAILSKTKILGDQKGLNIIIAVVIGFLALQLDFVPLFFREIFPRVGVGLAVMLTLLIFLGMFIKLDDNGKWPSYVMAAIGLVIVIIILAQTFGNYTWFSNWYSGDLVGWIVLGVLVAGLIIAVAVSGGSGSHGSGGHP